MSLRCGICFENAQPIETKDWRALLCGHVYHAHCLEQSFEHTKRCCPSCRVGYLHSMLMGKQLRILSCA